LLSTHDPDVDPDVDLDLILLIRHPCRLDPLIMRLTIRAIGTVIVTVTIIVIVTATATVIANYHVVYVCDNTVQQGTY
jgi:hypothetical protein